MGVSEKGDPQRGRGWARTGIDFTLNNIAFLQITAYLATPRLGSTSDLTQFWQIISDRVC